MEEHSETIIALAAVVQVGVAIILAFITAYYAHVTKKILDENKQMRIDAQKPNIEIYLDTETDSMLRRLGATRVRLHVDNIGAGTAYDVRFTIDRPFRIHDRLTVEDIPFLSQGISLFPPGHTRVHNLGDTLTSGINHLREKQLNIKVKYKDSMQKECSKNFPLNFREHIRE